MIAPLAALLRLHEINVAAAEPGARPVNKSEVSRLLQALTPALHQRYLNTYRRHRHNAVTSIERGACSGCHTRVPAALPELEVGVYECQHCGRMLYLPDEAYELYVG